MAAKSEREAFDTFAEHFRETLSCITSAYLYARQETKNLYKILFYPYPRLETRDDSPLFISITQQVLVVPHPEEEGRFKAKTRHYSYRALRHPTDETNEILGYHWHPDDSAVRYPHLHVRAMPRVHFPTSRVCLEDFVLMLIKYYEVVPRMPHRQWRTILDKNKEAFEKHASWAIYF